ncbi:cytochrome b/b6 domain-containing protein [Protaetiibacter sp. SSC-01]|uniref:cytochrome b/b6 domain-containing protein n=1 Tax=Protaetiibacter sp. SSC-01 TaxID=2759943 RepID=UPI001657012A|nr:cytochrome b/b6 domain-containing protein [Protaetiibacter sp. SSC-01]QNO37677.1 cytochrome b/b6 domain-containing protein [Protaetiibacter sp. SSC-01]
MSQQPDASPARRIRRSRWIAAGVALVALVVLAAVVVLVARWLRTLEPVQSFLLQFPGEYPLPDGSPVGLPAWLGWQHFFNAFFLVLIVRTGLQSRAEKQPPALWTSRRNRRRRMSLTVWLHLALDLLWIVNGVLYVVLLFATGQWVRIVPTSWDVFPNAISAGLQYASLDWPLEHAWLNYNSLQQLSYFAIVFLAAPLAIVSGARMSAFWPRDAKRLNELYPFSVAKAVHLPVMVFFIAFTVAHVTLVLATDALRNLNAMFAARDASDWVGFGIFALALLVIAGGWALVRPAIVDRIASAFGDVVRRSPR